ncbi:MAG TPA: LON peptidase substrate-binding domain-containing protein [Burkholderiales bacterium]|nr:LON peptidase substrate-binding domain-containing protein [Burkholderiales bacterium]
MTTTVPIFPLNTVLYPGSLLPLRIFEQRYLEMTRDCLRDSTPFGVCKIKEGVEVGKPALPEALGCTALIAEWEMPHLGVFHLKARGQQRFRIRHQTIQPSGLIRAEIDLLEEVPGSANKKSLALCRRVLEQIVGRLGAEYFIAPLAYDDPRWVSYRLAEVLPLALEEKQTLLETRDDHERLMRLYGLLKSSA